MGVIVIDEASTDFAAIRPDDWQQFCSMCGVQKARVEFAVDRHRPSGRKPLCKRCDSARSLARYYANRGPQPVRHCSECGEELEGRQRVCCGSAKCRERRFRRLHPEEYAERERQKVIRRREKRRQLRGREDLPAAARFNRATSGGRESVTPLRPRGFGY